MKVIEVMWFTTPRGCIGIAVGEVEPTKERRAYISVVTGHDEVLDTQYILDYGTVLPLPMVQRLVASLTQGGN